MDEELLAAANAPLPDEVRPASTEPEAPKADETEEAAASTDETGDEAAADTEADEGDKPKKAKGVQKRLDELTRQREDAKRERDYWREMAMKAGKPDPSPTPAAAPASDPAPRQEDFQTYEDFVAAKARFEVRQELKAEQERAAKAQSERTRAEKITAFNEARVKAAERYEDFETVFDSAIITPPMADVILESEKPADLAYYLGSHPDEAKRIATLSPIAAARELGRIEAKLAMPAPRKTTKAPDPVKPVTGGSDVVRKNPADMSMEEFRAARERGEIR